MQAALGYRLHHDEELEEGIPTAWVLRLQA
jgi:hypothetical protein